jgi:flagellin
MSMVINTNIASSIAQAAQAKTNQAMDTAMERLSTGKRINSAADDAAGMAIATRMESQIKGMAVAMRNAGDAQALIDTAEGAQDEITNVLQRMRELAVQAASDTNVGFERVNLQTEVTQLIAEIDRIATQTTWNDQTLLDGTFTSKAFQIGAGANQSISVNIDSVASSAIGNFAAHSTVQLSTTAGGGILADTYTIVGPEGSTSITTTAGDSAKEFAADVNAVTASTGVSASAVTKLKLHSLSAADTIALTINGTSTASVAVTSATDLRGLMDAINAKSGTTGVTATLFGGSNAALELVDADGDDIQISLQANTNATEINVAALDRNGALADSTAGTDDLDIKLVDTGGTAAAGTTAVGGDLIVTGQVSLNSYAGFNVQVANDGADYDETGVGAVVADGEFFGDGDGAATSTTNGVQATVSTIDLSTRSGSETALSILDGAMDKINSARGELGAISNRLDYTISNLTNIKVNIEASKSRIEDADFAVETSNLTKSQILSQAATAMLAQANASKQSVLSLLQG